MKKVLSAILAVMIIIAPALSFNVFAEKEETIKVGYYPYENYQEVDENGNCGGYMYDYLQEISQYASWNYKFVVKNMDECYELLKSKKIDIICGVTQNENNKKYFDYSSYPVGAVQYALFTNESNSMKYEDFDSFNGCKVGVIKNSCASAQLTKLCKEAGFTCEVKEFASRTEMNEAVKSGEVDAAYDREVIETKKNNIIARGKPVPIYIATWKGNPLISVINDSLWKISNNSPYFENELTDKYIENDNSLYPDFTKNELDYIHSVQNITVAYDLGRYPIEYYDEESQKMMGISADILNLIEEYSGLNFIFSKTDNFSDAVDMIKNGRADILASINRDYDWATNNNVLLSNSFYNSSVSVVKKQNTTISNSPTVAIVSGYSFGYKVNAVYPRAKIVYFDTAEECIKAVKKGRVEITYLDSSEAEYYTSMNDYSKLVTRKAYDVNGNMSIAVAKSENKILLNIINKTLDCIPSEKINNLVISNITTSIEQNRNENSVWNHLATVIVSVVITSAVIFSIGLIFFYSIKKKEKAEKSKENDALTGLLNREAAQKHIEKCLEEEKNDEEYISPVYLVNLDNFKQIIQKYGYANADKVLISVSEILKQCVRSSDIVARIGKDEFMIYLCNLKELSVVNMKANMMCKKINSLGDNDEKCKGLSASIGIAGTGEGCRTYSEIVAKANEAMKEAKENGKNRFVIYDGMITE